METRLLPTFSSNWLPILLVNQDAQVIYQARAHCLATYVTPDRIFKVNMPFIERQSLLLRGEI